MFFTLFSLIIFGLIFGSLGSVIFFRLGNIPTRQTLKGFLFGRSQCRHCHHTLHTKDLIPLWSFFSQGGKCRYCKAKLPRWYPVLELWTVAIFVGVWLVAGEVWRMMAGIWLLFIITLYDLKEYELHITASISLFLLSILGQWRGGYNLWETVQGMLIFFWVFLLMYFLAKWYVRWKYKKKAEGLGFGDVIMAGILGSTLPVFVHITGTIEWIYFISMYVITSCILGIILYGIQTLTSTITKKNGKTLGAIIPFLPAMSIAFLIFIGYGNTLTSFLVHF